MRRTACSIVALTVALLAALGPAPARAHSYLGIYTTRWAHNGYTFTPGWRFTTGFPSDVDWRQRVREGNAQWVSRARGVAMVEHADADYADFAYSTCPSTYSKNAVHYNNISSFGATWVCWFQGHPEDEYSAQIVFDRSPTLRWHTTLTTPSTAEVDLASVSAHEFGHAYGRISGGDGYGHWSTSSTSICGWTSDPELTLYQNTMCKYLVAGSVYARDLQTLHDGDTFDSAYP